MKWRVFYEESPGEGGNDFFDWWISAFLRALRYLYRGYRVRIIPRTGS